MLHRLSLRVLTLVILWMGLGVLKLDDMTESGFFLQGAVFSFLILAGALFEIFFCYQGDPYLLPVVQTILAIGLVFLTRINPALAADQFIWANLGLIIYYAVFLILRDYRKLGEYQYLWGMLALLMLLLTLIFGTTINGATSWFRFAGMGFQPEELVKVALLLFLASYLSDNKELLRFGTIQVGKFSLPDAKTMGPFVFIGVFVLGLLGAQKSLGTALVFFLLMVFILYVATERLLYLVVSVPLVMVTGAAGYILFDHVRVRVATWINPWLDASGGAYQISQSIFAISGGRLLGTGLGNGIGAYQIPNADTDFIFSVIAEEIGFIGAMAVISLFIIVVMRCFCVSTRAVDRFGQILAAGIGILIGVEALIILAGVTKMLPLTGLPLPWMSYGGSSMVGHFLLLGILAGISHSSAFSVSQIPIGKQADAL
ncbi:MULTISPECIES: FtsW/RodA/SpoVE family cell cycle protein [Dehalobacter]|uniref:Cell division protein n=2 Tax=Dehalobacter restrictus TaxID=55583 RepID=A0ABN4BQI0_DEHRP|nr:MULTISPECIES: FtsW/RodA/SpoVE family cell cycle protein [Dehalobacter]AHF09539.1 cell division protein [Dehalobacter restrictus DSM 9455]MDJ0306313.1 FtsW/RodA/SpoVE family cell cycle protein [Dehalobacter sp.]